MRLNKKQLNEMLHQALGEQYSIEKLSKSVASQYNVESGYHVYCDGNILTDKPLGTNLMEAKIGLKQWLLTKVPRPDKYTRCKLALEFLYATYPKCFKPLREKGERFALAIGIRQTLIKDVADKLPLELSLSDIQKSLQIYCISKKYRKVKSIAGTPRVNLAGEIVGEVTEEEVKRFLAEKKKQKAIQKTIPKVVVARKNALSPKRLKSKFQKSGANMQNQNVARVEVQRLKITLLLKPEQIPRNILPVEGTPGIAKMKFYWDIVLVGGQTEQIYRVSFSGKNYRKCLKNIDKCQSEGINCIVVLTGNLVNGFAIENAGLTVQVKIPKAAPLITPKN